jgi:glycosyltransferase involved in cell wall biosynthesis
MRHVSKEYGVKAILPRNSDKKLLRYLESDNIDVTFFETHVHIVAVDGFKAKIRRRFKNLFSNISLAKQLNKEDLENSIIHIDVTPWSNFLLLQYLALRSRVFITFHTPLPRLSGFNELIWRLKFKLFCRSANIKFSASNQEVKLSLERFLTPKIYDNVAVVYPSFNQSEINATLTNKSSRELIAQRYNLDSSKFWLCNVGQFIDRKGCWILLESLKKISEVDDGFLFYWLGTKDISEETKLKIASFGLKERFRFLSGDEIGPGRSDLLQLLSAAEAFVMPSLEEGLPVALIEAMALGKCCLASNINAIPEAIKHNENGILFGVNSSEELTTAIVETKNNSQLRQKLESNSRSFAVETFGEDLNGERMLREYEKSFNEE